MGRTVEFVGHDQFIVVEEPLSRQDFGVNHSGGIASCIEYEGDVTIWYLCPNNSPDTKPTVLTGKLPNKEFEAALEQELNLVGPTDLTKVHKPGAAEKDFRSRILSDYAAMQLLADGRLVVTDPQVSTQQIDEVYRLKYGGGA